MAVHLNFINRSNDTNNARIVIFQKNAARNTGEIPIAWRVIDYCGVGDNHPFTFPLSMTVAVSDDQGGYTPQIEAMHGASYHAALMPSGITLLPSGQASSNREIQVFNFLQKGAIDAGVYKDGRLLALRTQLGPNQEAAFAFKPSIWIGTASQVTQGEVLHPSVLSEVSTELSLQGIASADIVMTGGGPGENAPPFAFSMQNIVMA